MTEVFGFAQECRLKLNAQAWTQFCRVFDCLPLAAVISDAIFCVHGGISPTLRTLSQIDQIARPVQIPASGFVTDLLWSDPMRGLPHYGASDRGMTFLWGLAPARQFLKANGLKKIVRAHQVAMDGFDFPFRPDECVVTLFTASNYGIEFNNKAAFMRVNEALACDFRILQAPHSLVRVSVRGRSNSIEARPVKEVPAERKLSSSGPIRRPATTIKHRPEAGAVRRIQRSLTSP
jgi:serine/threonine-protein phosphatase PP1 catalytic subunit